MKEKQAVFLVAAICGALLAGGCGQHEVVKADEPLVQQASAQPLPASSHSVVTGRTDEAPAGRAGDAQQEGRLPGGGAAGERGTEQAASAGAGVTAELKGGLAGIYFNFDSANLSEQARATLAGDAEALKKLGTAKVRIEGNCDERGSDDYNLALGEKRARQALQYLVNLGVPAEQLTVVSYGKEKPADAGHDEASWAKNRRDELVVLR